MDNNTIETESIKVQDPEEKIEPEERIEKNPIKINRKTIVISVVIVILALGYIFKGLFIGAYEYRAYEYNLNAAVVNGSPISRLSVIQKLEKSYGKNLLDSLVNEKLIGDEASAKGITVSDDEANAAIKQVEDQISAQGSTLGAELAAQGMSMDDFKNQIILRKKVEKLLGDKINVTDQEIDQYIKDNKVSIPAGQEAAARDQIKSSLIDQKLNTEAPTLISDLKSKAKIQYFVNY